MISVVIPLFNEQGSLEPLQERLYKVMKELGEYEIIYVDDGSTDSSLEVLKKLKGAYPEVRIISLSRNHGQSTALIAGFKICRGDWIVTLDADLQNPPEEIGRLFEHREKFDFITGIRKERKDSSVKKTSSCIAGFFRRLILDDATQDVGCSLRAFRREVIECIPLFKNFHRFFPFFAAQAGFRVEQIPVAHQARTVGKSKYGTLKRLREGICDLIGASWLKKRLMLYEIKYQC
ncbi:MAG: glycosyltransferase family 2 protein [Candidatus Omnitrophota bacterium]|nr:MAG: glycosyltransferase family 2 protein [Candidatus Omnitrophota bacterium]